MQRVVRQAALPFMLLGLVFGCARPALQARGAPEAIADAPKKPMHTATEARYFARQRAIEKLESKVGKLTSVETIELATLHAEAARFAPKTNEAATLRRAIGLYKRAIADLSSPDVRPEESSRAQALAEAFYLLGHAYQDAGRVGEAQQVWRSLVCHNLFPYPTAPDPSDPERDSIAPKPQDNTVAHWTKFRERYREPRDLKKSTPETTYNEIYPDTCQSVSPPASASDTGPKYLAEVWWQIGNWELSGADVASGELPDEPRGVWGLNRAASAFRHAIQFPKAAVYPFALLKYATTLRSQQRYAAATQVYVQLLRSGDEPDVRALRESIHAGLAKSLVTDHFEGPPASEPFVQRPDSFDVFPDRKQLDKVLRPVLVRVQDAYVIPQDQPWTPEVYIAVADELGRGDLRNLAIDVYRLVLTTFPLSPEAALAQRAIVEMEERMQGEFAPGTNEHGAIGDRLLASKVALFACGVKPSAIQPRTQVPATVVGSVVDQDAPGYKAARSRRIVEIVVTPPLLAYHPPEPKCEPQKLCVSELIVYPTHPADADRVLANLKPELTACLDDEQPLGQPKSMTFRLKLGPNGDTESALLQNSSGAPRPDVQACVSKVLRRARFDGMGGAGGNLTVAVLARQQD
jgi:tetratricopeptide (TPR) repeat protein